MSTPFLDNVYLRVDFDRELVFKFFTVFSLFEYALKNAGFCIPGRRNGAQPDWEDFAQRIRQQFNPNTTPELSAAVNYMLNRPVLKQVIRNNSLTFVQRKRPQHLSDVEWLSVLIRGVRNNLFHGGKFRYDRPRDPKLIQHSMVILEAWAQCNDDVKRLLEKVS